MNVYARIIIDEARRRGVAVEILDEARNLFRLSHGGRSIRCHESLSDLTSAVAYEICSDKRLTADVLRRAGLPVPRQASVTDPEAARHVLEAWGALVVKPTVGEQGRGITVDVRDPATLARAIETARPWSAEVLLEEYVAGRDLRVIVIAHRFVAAIERVPATVTGDGARTVAELVQARNDELKRATGGESQIPLDEETRRAARLAGFGWDDVVPPRVGVPVRKTANYHTGGTIQDVTARVWPAIRRAAEAASRAIDIPMVGLDFVTPAFEGDEYVILEANERAGLANHEPQPTAERFLDLLFPETA